MNKISNINFGNLYSGFTLKNGSFLNNKNLTKQLNSIRYHIKKNGLHKKENVDIILQHSQNYGFYGVISSKKEGVPMHPDYKCKISNIPLILENFKNWVEDWNIAYSPSVLNKLKK